MRASAPLSIALLSAISAFFTGCTPGTNLTSTANSGTATIQIAGHVHGGQQPVSGATIKLYTVGTSGDGSASTSLLSQSVTTDANGNFNITNLYSCTNATLVYLVATGGNPGLGSNNANIAMMAALGPCSSLTSSTFVNINEVTTVASVYALAPFMNNYSAIGSGTSDVAALTSAFTLATEYANSATGISPGNSAPAGYTIPTLLINTLADVVSACINSTGGISGDDSICGQFFALTTPGNSTAPTDTLAALLYLADNPTLNTSLLYNLINPTAPFQPYLSATPIDFRIALASTTPAALQLTPSTLTFSNTTVGTQSAAQSITVQNTSSAPVSLTGLALVGANGSDFSYTNGCGTTLQANASCSIQVTVTPTVAGSRIGYMAISSNTPSSPQFVTLSSPALTPSITAVYPTQIIVNTPNINLVVTGTNFAADSTVLWNGIPLDTQTLSAPYPGIFLSAQLPVSLVASPATVAITVTTPGAAATSNAIDIAVVYPPIPTLTSISAIAGPINQPSTITLTGSGFTSASTVAYNGVTIPSTFTSSGILTATIPAAELTAPGVGSVTVTTPAPGGGTSAAASFTAYTPIINNSMIYNPVNGLFYLSVPSYAPAPYANSIVSVDPVTGALGTPIPVGSEPNRLAISSDGQYLWVALDGASAVRQVNLATGTAGLQFPLPADTTFEGPGLVASMAAIPGQPNSVAVMTYFPSDGPNGILLAIYDSGVPRPTTVSYVGYDPFPWAMAVHAASNEIYGPGGPLGSGYSTYTYDSNGITLKFSTSAGENTAQNNVDDIQFANSALYTSYGQAINPENAAVLGTFYSSGTTAAQGSIAVDTTLGKAFFLENEDTDFVIGTGFSTYQIGAFNLSDYTATSDTPIQIAAPESRANYQWQGPTGPRLTRWGSNGLAFHGTGGFVSLRSSLVQDLSTTNADLAVTLTSSGTTTTGNTTIYTATVTNNGPSSASSVDLTAFLPSTGILISATPSSGTCATLGPVSCDLGSLPSNGTAAVTIAVQQLSSGNATMTVQVGASENDPVPVNNQASSTQTITGGEFSASPTLTSISPEAIASGSSATNLTVTGTGFNSSSTVLLNGTPLSTTFNSSTSLTAVVPPADLATLGWAAITVSTPAPGGGSSAALPLSIFSVLKVGANHILYDPYSRNLMASIGAGTTSVAANSILAITPDTASIGTPVPIGGAPTDLALTYDGQILYTLLPTTANGSIARFNMLTQQPDFTVSGFQSTNSLDAHISDVAAMPGTENTVAIYIGEYTGAAVIDFNTAQKTAAERANPTGVYSGMCPVFLSSTVLAAPANPDAGEGVTSFPVTASGTSRGSNTPVSTGCFKLIAGIAYGEAGAVINFNPATPLYTGKFNGALPLISGTSGFGMEADPSLNAAFYPTLASSASNVPPGTFDSISTFDTTNFVTTSVLSLPFASIEGSSTNVSPVDTFRWGQDGLAILTSTGNVYLLRGPAIVPQLLNTNTAATLNSNSLTAVTHGAGNILLTLTGANFIPGVAALWNGNYRTTTIVDSTHLTMAIPASDLAAAGSATITLVNPGAVPSAPLTITVQ
jgi:trimeric autotransporter adhesin